MKYKMDSIKGQESAITFLRENIADPPHILLFGPTGVGKTMLANAWISEQLTYQGIPLEEHNSMILQLNSTEERGIAVVRQKIIRFVKSSRQRKGTVAWILLDDAEILPVATQQALRRILELYHHSVRFCFVTKDVQNIIEPNQSRCVLIELKPVGEALIQTKGDYRQYLLQQKFKEVSSSYCKESLIKDRLIEAIKTQNLSIITQEILDLFQKGLSFEDCLSMIEDKLPYELLYICAECHILLIQGNISVFDLIQVLSSIR